MSTFVRLGPTSVAVAVPRAPLYAPVPPVIATGALFDCWGSSPCAVIVPLERCSWIVQRTPSDLASSVQTARL